MPPLDSMAMSPEDRAMRDLLHAMQEELKEVRAAQQQTQQQAQQQYVPPPYPYSSITTQSGGIGGSIVGATTTGGTFTSGTLAQGSLSSARLMYGPPAPKDFIGPFTFQQMKVMENRLIGNWEARPPANFKPNEIPVDEWWFAPTEAYATTPKQTGAQMGDWQLGYDKGYEDGKAGK